tara:strand:- start:382 stop:768 length:387 start_codon:yes stop_codon:yes gene_type:complete
MGYLLIKHLHTDDLQLKETNYSYKLLYKKPYLILNKILIQINNYTVNTINKTYLININTSDGLQEIKLIDKFIQNKINSIPLLKGNQLYLKNNSYIQEKLNTYNKQIFISLFMVKKNAYQSTPIVYLL